MNFTPRSSLVARGSEWSPNATQCVWPSIIVSKAAPGELFPQTRLYYLAFICMFKWF